MKNKMEYLSELKLNLKKVLPTEEAENAFLYFEEYILEAELSDYGEIEEKLGTPKEVSYNAIIDYQEDQLENKESTRRVKWLLPITLLLSAPVGLPLILAGILIVLSALIILGIGLFLLNLIVVLCWGIGGVLVLMSAYTLFHHVPTGLFNLGSGLVLIALAWILTPYFITFSKQVSLSVYKFLLNKIRPKKRGEVSYHD